MVYPDQPCASLNLFCVQVIRITLLCGYIGIHLGLMIIEPNSYIGQRNLHTSHMKYKFQLQGIHMKNNSQTQV